MNLKKRIICAILCSALIIPVSATIAENSNNIVTSTIVSADDTDGDYLASVDISVPRETYIYGESAIYNFLHFFTYFSQQFHIAGARKCNS